MKTFNKRLIPILCALAAIGTASSAGAAGTTKDKMKSTTSSMSSGDVQKHAYDRSTQITFNMGSADLAEGDKTKIRELVTAVGSDNGSRVEVVAWSDKPFPKTGADLPKMDRDLADQRTKNINNFIKDELNVSSLKIKTYNMAETSNWLARTFRTDEAELKSIFSKEAQAPMARADYNVISKDAAPSKAIIVVVPK